jgi:hypothetical protein
LDVGAQDEGHFIIGEIFHVFTFKIPFLWVNPEGSIFSGRKGLSGFNRGSIGPNRLGVNTFPES